MLPRPKEIRRFLTPEPEKSQKDEEKLHGLWKEVATIASRIMEGGVTQTITVPDLTKMVEDQKVTIGSLVRQLIYQEDKAEEFWEGLETRQKKYFQL